MKETSVENQLAAFPLLARSHAAGWELFVAAHGNVVLVASFTSNFSYVFPPILKKFFFPIIENDLLHVDRKLSVLRCFFLKKTGNYKLGGGEKPQADTSCKE